MSSVLLTIKFVPSREEFCFGNLRLSASSGFLCVLCVEVLTLAVDSAFGFLRVFAPPRWMFLFWGCGSAALWLTRLVFPLTAIPAMRRALRAHPTRLFLLFVANKGTCFIRPKRDPSVTQGPPRRRPRVTQARPKPSPNPKPNRQRVANCLRFGLKANR